MDRMHRTTPSFLLLNCDKVSEIKEKDNSNLNAVAVNFCIDMDMFKISDYNF